MAYDGLRTLLEMENRTVNYTQQLELILRLLVASLCGFAIGYERTNRLKEAGIRTHMIVAVGSALVMIVSKYGFFDVMRLNNVTLDPSRIAAQIVTGIGFLGAGTILVRRSGINGLTTAAGLWGHGGRRDGRGRQALHCWGGDYGNRIADSNRFASAPALLTQDGYSARDHCHGSKSG